MFLNVLIPGFSDLESIIIISVRIIYINYILHILNLKPLGGRVVSHSIDILELNHFDLIQ